MVMLARACERIAQESRRRRWSWAARRCAPSSRPSALVCSCSGARTPHHAQPAHGREGHVHHKAEEKHGGMRSAIAMYALIRQALRHAAGQTVDQYREASAKLFARFAAVARDNPLATRRKGYSAEQIAEVNAENPSWASRTPSS